MVERRAMANHLRAKIATLGLTHASVVAQTASYGFDIVVWQWLAPLLVGGRVVIYRDATAENPAALLAALARDGATVVETVPSFLEALVEIAERGAAPPLSSLEWMVSNAEALPPAVADRWHAQRPTVRLLNTCGATECSDDTTHGEVVASLDSAARVPVGRPIAGSTAAVVDERLRPVPPGCVGEIVLGGIVVGRGYLGDPVMTARAFVPDPFSAVPGARLYRTGDRGRWRADGVLECLGRQDDQVKVHGYRVELGEVEAALATLPGFCGWRRRCRTDARGQRRLVAHTWRRRRAMWRSGAQGVDGKCRPTWCRMRSSVSGAAPRAHDKLDRAALPAPPAIRETATKCGGSLTPIELPRSRPVAARPASAARRASAAASSISAPSADGDASSRRSGAARRVTCRSVSCCF
jgi:acyl-CoA synthetase (AMP-forming)/AMP-acid ligase II